MRASKLPSMCRGVPGYGWSLCACLQPSDPRPAGSHDLGNKQRQLVRLLGQEAASGRFVLPTDKDSMQRVLSSVASLGQLDALELLAAQVPPSRASPALARGIMLGALRSGLLCVVREAVAAATTPAEQRRAVLAGLLGPHVDSLLPGILPDMLRAAKEHQRPALVALLLDAEYPMTHEALCVCVAKSDFPALAAALSRGTPALPPAYLPDYSPIAIPSQRGGRRFFSSCCITSLLERRKDYYAEVRFHEDAEYLPLLEQLLDAGYRPAIYEDVYVSRGGGPAALEPRFDPIWEDAGLDLGGCNKYMWLAVQRPAWSPSEHHRFPPAFRAAAQALLLAAHRWASTTAEASAEEAACLPGSAQLGALPFDVLLKVLALAAWPLSGWIQLEVREPEGCCALCEFW